MYMPPPIYPRTRLGVATTLAVLAAFVLGFATMAVTALTCFEGDGGEPFVKAGSARAKVCAVEKPVFVPLNLLGVPAMVLAGGVLALRRRRWRPLGIGCAVAVAVTLVPAAAVQAVSPDADAGAYAAAGAKRVLASVMISSSRASSPARMSAIGSGSPLTIDSKKSLRSW
jgi:hypothetical protein